MKKKKIELYTKAAEDLQRALLDFRKTGDGGKFKQRINAFRTNHGKLGRKFLQL